MASNSSVCDDDKETMQTVEDDDVELCQSGDSEEFNFSTKTWREDMTLIVENRKLYVASNILSLVSPVFTAMFEDPSKEEGPREIKLPGKQSTGVLEFLRCIYPSSQKKVSAKNVRVVLPLADEYKVTNLKKVCEDFLVDETTERTSPDDICLYLQHAFNYKLDDLKAKCLKYAAAIDIDKFSVAETKHPLPLEIKAEIKDVWIEKFINNMKEMCKLETELKAECHKLGEFVKYFWAEKGGNARFTDGEVGTLTFSIPNISKLTVFISPKISVNGIDWSIVVKTYANKDKVEHLSVFLVANAPKQWKDWSCDVLAKIIIPSNETGNHYETGSGSLYYKYSSQSDAYGYPEFIATREVMSRKKYVVNDILKMKVCLLVKEPVSKPYRK